MTRLEESSHTDNPQQRMSLTRVAFVLGLVMLTVVAGHLLPILNSSDFHREVRNALHVVAFAAAAALFFKAVPGSLLKKSLVTFLLSAALALLAELFQQFVGLSFDYFDIVRDLLGVLLLLIALVIWQISIRCADRRILSVSLRALSLSVGTLIFVPVAFVIYVQMSLSAAFPVVLDFDGQFDERLMFPLNSDVSMPLSAPNEPLFSGQVASMQLRHGRWSGLRIEPVTPDWSDFDYVVMSARVLNGATDSVLEVHLTDVSHPGFRSQHLIGVQDISAKPVEYRFRLEGVKDVPGRPSLDIGNVRQLTIIAASRTTNATLVLDNIRLE